MRSDNAVEEIKNRIRLSSFISRYLRVEEKGRKKVCLCPFHDDHNPSMQIDDEKGNFKCWSCGAGGDVFTFLMHMERIDFKSALQRLADECNITLQTFNKNDSSISLKAKKQELYDIYSLLVTDFKNYLLSEKKDAIIALDYLKSRGITLELIEQFGIGYSPDDKNYIVDLLKSKGYSDDTIYSSGLFSPKKWPYFADGRIMLPILDEHSRPVAFSARTLSKSKDVPKYINSSETLIFKKSENFFSLAQSLPYIRKKNPPIICEGNFDAIALYKSGLKTALASCGTAFTDDHVAILKRFADYYNSTIYLFPDSDEAGIKASFKWIEKLVASDFKVKVMTLDGDVKDADEACAKFGDNYLIKRFDNAIIDVEYIYNIEYALNSKSGIYYKKDIVKKFQWYYDALPVALQKEALVDFLSKKLSVSKGTVDEIFKENLDNKKPMVRVNIDDKLDFDNLERTPFYEMDMMDELLRNRKYFDSELLEDLSYNDLKSKRAKIIYSRLASMDLSDVENDEKFVSATGDVQLENYIRDVLNKKTDDDKTEAVIKDSMLMIKKAKLKSNIDSLEVFGKLESRANAIVLKKMAEYNNFRGKI